jgi:hypothetical protein
MDLCATLDLDPAANPCGSGLAREGGGSKKSSLTDTQHSQASPLPQLICAPRWISIPPQNPRGSGLARESGGSKKSLLTDTPPSRASPLPQWICVPRWISIPPQNPCGSGLARESGGSKKSSPTDAQHSRASPLPHWFFVAARILSTPPNAPHRNLWCQHYSGYPVILRMLWYSGLSWRYIRRYTSVYNRS